MPKSDKVAIFASEKRKDMYSHYEEIAKSMGYYVDKSGQAYSPRGNKVGTCGREGYMYLGVRVSQKKVIKVYIHRLQAYQKFGNKIYEKDLEIRHLNNDIKDNSYSNIDIGTHKENMMDVPKEVRVYNAKYASSAVKTQNRISDEIALEIKKKNQNGVSYKKLMQEYNISSKGTLSFIINKRIISRRGADGSLPL